MIRNAILKEFKKFLMTVLIFYVVMLALLFIFQRHLQYVPTGKVGSVSDYNLNGFSEEILTTKDGLKILAWYKKPALKKGKIILYFHGNAGNLGMRSEKFTTFAKDGFGILGITYRGYFGSEGSPSQQGLMLDGQAALAFLLDQGYQLEDIILFGESLGSGVAVQLAAHNDFHAVILESPFSSIPSVAKKTYWFAPVELLIKDKFESVKVVAKVRSPILIIHGTADKVVPYGEGEKLFDHISSKRKFVSVPDAGHLDFTEAFLLDEIKAFLKES